MIRIRFGTVQYGNGSRITKTERVCVVSLGCQAYNLAGNEDPQNVNHHSMASMIHGVYTISDTSPTDQLPIQVHFISFHNLLQIIDQNSQQIFIQSAIDEP